MAAALGMPLSQSGLGASQGLLSKTQASSANCFPCREGGRALSVTWGVALPTQEMCVTWVRLGCVLTARKLTFRESGTTGVGKFQTLPLCAMQCSKSCLIWFCCFEYLVNMRFWLSAQG